MATAAEEKATKLEAEAVKPGTDPSKALAAKAARDEAGEKRVRADGLSEKHAQRCHTLYQRIVSETDPNLARNIKADEPVPPGFRKVDEPLVQAALSKGKPRKARKNETQPRKPAAPPGLKDELRAKLKALGKELGKELGTTGTTEQLQGRLDRVRREQQRQQQPSSPIAKKKKKTA